MGNSIEVLLSSPCYNNLVTLVELSPKLIVRSSLNGLFDD